MNGCIYRTEHDVCKKYTTDKATSFCVGRNCLERKPSNSDRIRAMTDEEMEAEFWRIYNELSKYSSSAEWFHEWLKQESGGK